MHLLQKTDGRLVYIIGGDIDDEVSEETIRDEEIETLLDFPGISDKRILVFPQPAVNRLAAISGEKLRVPKRGGKGRDDTSACHRSTGRRDGRQPRKKKHQTHVILALKIQFCNVNCISISVFMQENIAPPRACTCWRDVASVLMRLRLGLLSSSAVACARMCGLCARIYCFYARFDCSYARIIGSSPHLEMQA